MKRILKWIGIILGGLIILVSITALGFSIAGTSRLNKTYNVQAANITIPTDEAALARGEHLVDVFCRDCHAADLSGQLFMDEPPIGTVYTPNLSGGAEVYNDDDLVLAIRHGLDSNSQPLLIMPAESFIHLSEEDLGALLAFLQTVPRTGEELPEKQIHPIGRILAGAGLLDSTIPAAYIDHDQSFPDMPEVGANPAYGEYLARFCQSCHGANLAGGQPPDPDSPPGPSLTPNGALGNWTEEDFLTAIRTGVTPDGRQLNPDYMPWRSIGKFENDELRGLWLYLESLPPREINVE
jgi:mono/diheme cytochrome c family protein